MDRAGGYVDGRRHRAGQWDKDTGHTKLWAFRLGDWALKALRLMRYDYELSRPGRFLDLLTWTSPATSVAHKVFWVAPWSTPSEYMYLKTCDWGW